MATATPKRGKRDAVFVRYVWVVGLALLAGCAQDSAPDLAHTPVPVAVELPEVAWSRIADASLPRAEQWAAEVDGKIYVIGGYIIPTPLWETLPGGPAGAAPVPTAAVEVYDIASDSWSMGVDYPGPVDHHPTVAFEGVIYVFKAPAGDENYYRFDPRVGEWEPFTAAPNSHHAGGIGIIGDRIYLAGNNDWVDAYDPRNDTWESFPGDGELPTIRNHVSGGAVHGKLYLAAGDIGGHSSNTDANEEFDPATGNWTSKAPIPVVRGSAAGVSWMDHVVIIGGQSGDDGTPAYANVDAYDPVSDSWLALPELPQGVHGTAAVVVDDAIYVLSGAPLQGVYGTTASFVLKPV